MNPFEMVVLIVAIVMIASVIKARARARDNAALTADSPDAEAMRIEIARLKDRVEVLERLATDKSRRLADEIDSLRSQG
jgi:hypothetical protein